MTDLPETPSSAPGRVVPVDDASRVRILSVGVSEPYRQQLLDIAEAVEELTHLDTALERIANSQCSIVVIECGPMDPAAATDCLSAARGTSIPVLCLLDAQAHRLSDTLISAGAACCLILPLRPEQLIPILRCVLSKAAERAQLAQRVRELKETLQSSNDTHLAMGLLIAHLRVSRAAAYQMIRGLARKRRTKIATIVGSIIEPFGSASELLEHLRNADIEPTNDRK